MFQFIKIGIAVITLLITTCNQTTTSSNTTVLKNNAIAIKGVTVEAPPNVMDSAAVAQVSRTNCNWIGLIPFGFGRQHQPGLTYNTNRQWWGEKDEGIIACIQLAHANNMQVLLKPQLWIGGGTYTGDFVCTNETDWLQWEKNYTAYILHNALLAHTYKAEMLCIGTEMDATVTNRPMYWSNLIDSVKAVYKGKLTYAANWNTYDKFTAWKKLDYIGVDAYFPLVANDTPTIAELQTAWKPHITAMQNCSIANNNIPILFTEYGYRSVDACANKPWESYKTGSINMVAQSNAYEALFTVMTTQPWFAGGFVWKWHTTESKRGDWNSDYTPQNKPAESVVAKWYKL